MFLSLSGILILALLGTLVETARYTVCVNHAARTIRTSTEALLTEYSRPLYDNYGLFFMESGGTAYEKVIADYAGDTMETPGHGTMDFLTGEIRQVQVTDKTYLGDDNAGALQEEINQYMLRKVTKKQLDKLLKRSSDVTGTEETAQDIEEMVEEQRKEAELDGQLLKLMKKIDGISVSRGKISCAGEFVKMFAVGELKSQNFGVTENAVWKKMKKNIDVTPRDWSKLNQNKFLSKVDRVLALTEEAIDEADGLKAAYQRCSGKNTEFADHDKKMGQLLGRMSALEGNKAILSRSRQILQEPLTEDTRDELEELWKGYDTDSISFDYTGVGETGGGENPLDTLSGAWGGGILNLVCEDPRKLSKAEVSEADNFAKLYREQEDAPADGRQKGSSEDYGSRVTDLTEDEEVSLSGIVGDLGGYGMDEFCLDTYIQDRFASYVETIPNWKKALKYQWEYIVAGKVSDKANLESVLTRILFVRTPVNFAAIYGDSAKNAQAYAAAAAIVGFTGLEPLIRLVQTLVLVVWALVESMVDLAGLLQGRDVPVVKSSARVLTSFPEIFQLSGTVITQRAKKLGKAASKSFGYKDYLLLFLAMTRQSTRLYRVMDLIQWDMVKNGYTDFELGTCVFSLKVSATVSFPTRFFRMPVISKMLERDIQGYSYTCEITKGYLR